MSINGSMCEVGSRRCAARSLHRASSAGTRRACAFATRRGVMAGREGRTDGQEEEDEEEEEEGEEEGAVALRLRVAARTEMDEEEADADAGAGAALRVLTSVAGDANEEEEDVVGLVMPNKTTLSSNSSAPWNSWVMNWVVGSNLVAHTRCSSFQRKPIAPA